MVSDSLVLCFDTHLYVSVLFSGHQKDVQRKTIQSGGGISSRSAVKTRLVTKTMPRIAHCWELIATGGQGCPGKLVSLIFIGFQWFQEDLRLSGPESWATCGGLWQISAAPLRWYKVGCLLQSAAQ